MLGFRDRERRLDALQLARPVGARLPEFTAARLELALEPLALLLPDCRCASGSSARARGVLWLPVGLSWQTSRASARRRLASGDRIAVLEDLGVECGDVPRS